MLLFLSCINGHHISTGRNNQQKAAIVKHDKNVFCQSLIKGFIIFIVNNYYFLVLLSYEIPLYCN